MTRAREIAEWIRQQVTIAGAHGLVVGLSGGLDSAVVARLCQLAMPGAAVGAIMPCHSDPRDEQDADLLVSRFDLPAVRLDLAPAYDHLLGDLRTLVPQVPTGQDAGRPSTDTDAHLSFANIKPRLRMSALHFIANSRNYLVAGTVNRSELTVGYFTKHGDGAADLLPIGRLLKNEVRVLARELEIPEEIISKAPSAGLWSGQTDEEEMGFSYADLERYLTEGPDAVSPALAMRIERLVRMSEHKRTLALMPET